MPSRTSTRFFVVFCLLLVVITSALILTRPALAEGYPPPDEPTPAPVYTVTPAAPVTLDFWSNIIQATAVQVLPLLAAGLVAWILREAGQLWLRFKSMQPDIAGMILEAARVASRSAEQYLKSETGEAKKAYALQVAQNWLLAQGVKVDLKIVSAAIEAAVLDEFNRFKLEDPIEADDPDVDRG